MIEQLPHLLWLGLIATTLDIDNALYMTSVTQGRSENDQKNLVFWGLIAEFVSRLVLILIAFYVATGKEPLFSIEGFAVTPQVLALLGAGLFLFFSSASELIGFLAAKDDQKKQDSKSPKSTWTTVLVQMTIVNTVLSIDTVIAVAGMTKLVAGAAVILAVSGLIRLLFVRQIAGFISAHPETKIVILSFLTLIGLQLLLQAFKDDLPESVFNLALAVALVVALFWRRDAHKPTREANS